MISLDDLNDRRLSIKNLPEEDQPGARIALYEEVLHVFAAGTADLTLEDMVQRSRTVLGMRAPDPRSG